MATNGTEVYIKLPSGRSARYDAHPSQQLRELCRQVAAEEGISVNQVRLKYQGKTLDNNKTIREYGVRVETILKAEFVVAQELDIVVDFGDGDVEEVVISNQESVSKLFQTVSSRRDIATSKLQFKVEGRSLPSSSTTLMEAGLARGTTISAAVVEPPPPSSSKRDVPQEMDAGAKENLMASFDARGRNVEIAFSFDTTGSMYSYLTEVRQKLRNSCTRLVQDIPNIRISIIAQGDYCDSADSYAVRVLDLTSDVQSLVDFAENVPCTSGGDSPECYELVLKKAQQLDWAEDSAKALVVIGDALPHPPSYTDQNIWWKDELDLLTGMDIKVYGVQAGNCARTANFYQELADVSGGCYLNLRHMDVITDMFLAVCYSEANENLLEDFEKELVSAGHMTNIKQEMFTQLKSKQEKKEDTTTNTRSRLQRHVAEPWWDRSLDQATPQYNYHADQDKWLPASRGANHVYSPPTTPVIISNISTSTRRSRRRHGSKRCSIM